MVENLAPESATGTQTVQTSLLNFVIVVCGLGARYGSCCGVRVA